MEIKGKIKFKQYTVNFKGHKHDILIPPITNQLWLLGYGDKHWGTVWTGNRESLESIMYSANLFGFNPTDKIIYFLIRKNKIPESYRNRGSLIGKYDMIFTTHQVPFKRSDWKKIKEILRYTKAETYTLCYDRERSVRYFERSVEKWKYSVDFHKEYQIETLQNDTVFYVFSRRIFQVMYLSFDEFLQRNLEEEFLENEIPPLLFGIQHCYIKYFPYRQRLQMDNGLEVEYGDMILEAKKS